MSNYIDGSYNPHRRRSASTTAVSRLMAPMRCPREQETRALLPRHSEPDDWYLMPFLWVGSRGSYDSAAARVGEDAEPWDPNARPLIGLDSLSSPRRDR